MAGGNPPTTITPPPPPTTTYHMKIYNYSSTNIVFVYGRFTESSGASSVVHQLDVSGSVSSNACKVISYTVENPCDSVMIQVNAYPDISPNSGHHLIFVLQGDPRSETFLIYNSDIQRCKGGPDVIKLAN